MDYRLVGVNELSEKLGVPPSWVYARTRIKGPDTIPCIRVGKYLKFKLDAVMEWIEQQNERY
jgi:predicted DNA-binding transcriptional regulator AlpA